MKLCDAIQHFCPNMSNKPPPPPKKKTHTQRNQDQQLLTKIKLCYYASPKMDNSVASSKQFFPFFFSLYKKICLSCCMVIYKHRGQQIRENETIFLKLNIHKFTSNHFCTLLALQLMKMICIWVIFLPKNLYVYLLKIDPPKKTIIISKEVKF